MTAIPQHYHFVYGLKPQTEPFHLAHYLCLASCLEVNKPAKLTLHYHYEPYGRYWDEIRERLDLAQVDLKPEVGEFDYADRCIGQKYRYAHHADFVRIEQLIAHGGIYADIDTLFVEPLPSDLLQHPVVMGREDPVICQRTGRLLPSVCNALIAARPAAPFLIELYEQMSAAFDGSWSGHSCQLIHEVAEQRPDEIHLEAPRRFYRFMWTREDLALLFEGFEPELDGISSIHLWSHLWWERRRRDFVKFHAGLITEARIRKINTTYNVLARRFLPAPPKRFWHRT